MEKNLILSQIKEEIQASIRCNTRSGYIDYRGCDNICMDMEKILEVSREHVKSGDAMTALEMASYIVVTSVKLASHADSSSGMLTSVVEEAIDLVGTCTNSIAEVGKENNTALSLLIRDSKKKVFWLN